MKIKKMRLINAQKEQKQRRQRQQQLHDIAVNRTRQFKCVAWQVWKCQQMDELGSILKQ